MRQKLEEIDEQAMLSLIEQEAQDLQTNDLLQDEVL